MLQDIGSCISLAVMTNNLLVTGGQVRPAAPTQGRAQSGAPPLTPSQEPYSRAPVRSPTPGPQTVAPPLVMSPTPGPQSAAPPPVKSPTPGSHPRNPPVMLTRLTVIVTYNGILRHCPADFSILNQHGILLSFQSIFYNSSPF